MGQDPGPRERVCCLPGGSHAAVLEQSVHLLRLQAASARALAASHGAGQAGPGCSGLTTSLTTLDFLSNP